jgi:enediyne biosynthesis protein E4
MGCCVADYDNEGRLDLYVTSLGRNTLYRGTGDGAFTDVTASAGVGGSGFHTGAAFADYDGDGYVDLFVCRYVDWAPAKDLPCTSNDGDRSVRVYCRPSVYPARQDILYHNNRNGTFTDVTRAAGMQVAPGRGLGCVWSDGDGDGDSDLFVANDMSANFLFINDGRGHFTEEAYARGVALSEDGRPQASMGVAAGDYDGDGLPDLACTNFSGEYLALYRNVGKGRFEDASARAGLIQASSPYVGFGLGFPDLNLDGWSDLFVGNGHVTEAAERFYPGVSFAQPSLCLLNDGGGVFVPAPDPGPAVTTGRVSRGVAFGDYNGDGAPDILVNNWRGAPDLLRNDFPNRGHWLRLALAGTRCNRSAIGARVEVTVSGRSQVQTVQSGGSYCSQSDLVLTFGLGQASPAGMVRVVWPGGGIDTWEGLPAGRAHSVREGVGRQRVGCGAAKLPRRR